MTKLYMCLCVLFLGFTSAYAQTLAKPHKVKLMVIIYNPILKNHGGVKLNEYFKWYDPDVLNTQLMNELKNSSHDRVEFEIAERHEADEWPIHTNGRRYDEDLYIEHTRNQDWKLGKGDYRAILKQFDVVRKVNEGLIDEVFIWTFPGQGMYESTMVGDGAYWCNSRPRPNISGKKFVVMTYVYEREVDLAIHSFGHRSESIMRHWYGSWENKPTHLWNQFSLIDKKNPGLAGIGNIHFPPNAKDDYDYDNSSEVVTSAPDWENFPSLTGATAKVTCKAWDCSQRGYMRWWFGHIPHADGINADGLSNNWWEYLTLERQ